MKDRLFAVLPMVFDALFRPSEYRRFLSSRRPSTEAATRHVGCKQLLVDISVLSRSDAGTGVQRATKELLRELTASPPIGYTVRPVCATRWRAYKYAGTSRILSKVNIQSGDIFLGLDLASRILPRHRLQLVRWQAAGARICVVMHDLLPLHRPEWFTRRNARAYRAWLHTVTVQADAVVCVSQVVAEQFRTWLASIPFASEFPPYIGWFHHGVRASSEPDAIRSDSRVANIALRPFVLMVGTIEPRKGYEMALDAFDALWRIGEQMQLVIVGRIGWKVESLVARLRLNTEAGRRLHWFDNADDEILQSLYAAATGVLVASHAEGFGLPIVEAALHKKPLLLRDLPVFHEIAGDGATYFSATTPLGFRREIAVWIESLHEGTAIPSNAIPCQSWSESARRLIMQLLPL
jgi:glycosyltransferase involved in cell wall biosynthesis